MNGLKLGIIFSSIKEAKSSPCSLCTCFTATCETGWIGGGGGG